MKNLGTTPILVTGMSRSGTTWTGKTLSRAEDTGYIYEPFNPDVRNRFGNFLNYQPLGIKKKFLYPTNLVGLYLRLRVMFMLKVAKCKDQRCLIKDPIASMASAWFADHFDSKVVVTIRHPAGVAASRTKLNWAFDFGDITSQKSLINGPLKAFSQDLIRYQNSEKKDKSIIADSAWLWLIVYTFLLNEANRRKDWIIVRHEDLCQNPVSHFENLYEELGLSFTNRIKAAIIKESEAKNAELATVGQQHFHTRNSKLIPTAWKIELNSEQVSLIRKIVGKLGTEVYPNEHW